MLKKITFFWWGILLCLLVLGGYGYYLYSKPRQSAADTTPSLSISADALYNQYESDELGCDRKYLGKVIEVTGKIAAVQHSGQSEIWILATNSATGGGVNCQLFPGDKNAGQQAKPGDQVTLKGKCTGFLIDVNLADCAVSK